MSHNDTDQTSDEGTGDTTTALPADFLGNASAAADERAAFEPLRRENAELRLDCQFLGKAAFFTSEQDR